MRALLQDAIEEAPLRIRVHSRKPRIVSEHADIDHLLAVVNQLCVLITNDVLAYPGGKVGKEYPLLRQAIWNARGAAYRVVKNRTERAKRKK